MGSSEAKGALRTHHADIGSASLTLIVFFLSCFTLAVLLHYLHYAVSHSHKQIYLKICIVKASRTAWRHNSCYNTQMRWKTASNCWKHFELCSNFTLLPPFPSQSLPFGLKPHHFRDVCKKHSVKPILYSFPPKLGLLETYNICREKVNKLHHIWIQKQQAMSEEDASAQRSFHCMLWCWAYWAYQKFSACSRHLGEKGNFMFTFLCKNFSAGNTRCRIHLPLMYDSLIDRKMLESGS